jgi:hypothetical protein
MSNSSTNQSPEVPGKSVFRTSVAKHTAKQAHQLYRLLSDRSRDIMVFFRPDGKIIEVNNRHLLDRGPEMSDYNLRARGVHRRSTT